MSWQSEVMVIPTPGIKKVTKVDIRLCAEDMAGNINVTDVMLQGGVLATIWSGHTSEIRFSFEQ